MVNNFLSLLLIYTYTKITLKATLNYYRFLKIRTELFKLKINDYKILKMNNIDLICSLFSGIGGFDASNWCGIKIFFKKVLFVKEFLKKT